MTGNIRSLACFGGSCLNWTSSHLPTQVAPLSPLQMSKKGAKNTKEVRQYAIGDTVLGKVRGYPPWPGVVSSQSRVVNWQMAQPFFFFFSSFFGPYFFLVLGGRSYRCSFSCPQGAASSQEGYIILCYFLPNGRLVGSSISLPLFLFFFYIQLFWFCLFFIVHGFTQKICRRFRNTK